MGNTHIYIYTHKDFSPLVHSSTYHILAENPCTCEWLNTTYIDEEYKIWGGYYSEVKGMLYLYEHSNQLPKYVGLCHYRRYFDFLDNIPDMDNIFDEYNIILPKISTFDCTNRQMYSICHNVEDWDNIKHIGSTIFNGQYKREFEIVDKCNSMYIANMFVMKREDYIKYCEWFFAIVNKFNDEYEIHSHWDAKRHIINNKTKYQLYGHSVIFQSRIIGFLSERLFNVYIRKHFNRIKEFDIYPKLC